MAWLDIRVKTEARNLNAVRSRIEAWPDEVAQDIYYPAIKAIAGEGLTYMRGLIEHSRTNPSGGRKNGSYTVRGGSGQYARKRSGDMLRGTRVENRQGKKSLVSTVGWVRGQPGYAVFQEFGTKNGIVAMDSISQTTEYMRGLLQALAKGRYQATNAELIRDES